MYVLISGTNDSITGPFKTADAAAVYARKQYPLAKWRVAPMEKPSK